MRPRHPSRMELASRLPHRGHGASAVWGSETEPLAGASKENDAQTCHQAYGHPTAAFQWAWEPFPNLERSGSGCSQGPPKGAVSGTHTGKWQVKKTITKPGLCYGGSFSFPKMGCHTSHGLRAPESPRLPALHALSPVRGAGSLCVVTLLQPSSVGERECGGQQKGGRAHRHTSRPDDVNHRKWPESGTA